MQEKTEILWSPAGVTLPSLGSRSLVSVSDGDTPNIRMPIRMLSIDTPEVTARSAKGAAKVDAQLKELAQWIKDGLAPISTDYGNYLLPKLENVDAGTLQFTQGQQASAFFKELVNRKLTRPNSSSKRNIFVRSPERPFDSYGRLLAYIAPGYSTRDRAKMTRRERATFNLDMIDSGWAAPFILFPSIPGELDLPLFIEASENAKQNNLGQYQNPLSLPGYEYRMCKKLYDISKKMLEGKRYSEKGRVRWRSRYCADMRDRQIFGQENYFTIPEPYRLWIWPDDVQQAIGQLNLIPA